MKKTVKNLIRARVFYSGRVQGVGFRYTAERFALELGLRGWVKNLPDNRVEILCEGPKEKIEELFLNIQRSSLGAGARQGDSRWEDATGEFKDFRIEYWV